MASAVRHVPASMATRLMDRHVFLDSGETVRLTMKTGEMKMKMNEEVNETTVTPWYLGVQPQEYERQLIKRLRQDRLEREAALLENAAAAEEEEEEISHDG